MLATFTEYRTWAAENTVDERVRLELLTAINWMEKNVAVIDSAILQEIDHPCLAFSTIIKSLLANAQNGAGSFQPIIDWLAENEKCPFGLPLKTKAYKIMRRSIPLLTKDMITQLSELQSKSQDLKYRPREFEFLDKLLMAIDQNSGNRPK